MSTNRPQSTEVENENLRPDGDGEPPRPATEPAGSDDSSATRKTQTNPSTGEPRT